MRLDGGELGRGVRVMRLVSEGRMKLKSEGRMRIGSEGRMRVKGE